MEGFLRYWFGVLIHGGTYFRNFTVTGRLRGVRLNFMISTISRLTLFFFIKNRKEHTRDKHHSKKHKRKEKRKRKKRKSRKQDSSSESD